MIREWKETTKYCNLHLYWFSRSRLNYLISDALLLATPFTLRWRSCELRENSGDHSLFSSLQSLVSLKGLYNVLVLRIWFIFDLHLLFSSSGFKLRMWCTHFKNTVSFRSSLLFQLQSSSSKNTVSFPSSFVICFGKLSASQLLCKPSTCFSLLHVVPNRIRT